MRVTCPKTAAINASEIILSSSVFIASCKHDRPTGAQAEDRFSPGEPEVGFMPHATEVFRGTTSSRLAGSLRYS